jgi:hypothetical protein
MGAEAEKQYCWGATNMVVHARTVQCCKPARHCSPVVLDEMDTPGAQAHRLLLHRLPAPTLIFWRQTPARLQKPLTIESRTAGYAHART